MTIAPEIGGFVLFAVVMTGTPGPNNAMVTVSGARVGVARTLPLTLGITGGVALMFVAMAIGLGALLERAPWLSAALRVASATLPAWIARKILTAGPLDPDDERPLLGWVGGAAFQWINPKAWAMTGSAATLHLPASPDAWSIARRAATLLVAGVVPVGAWSAFGRLLRGPLASPTFARGFNAAMAALLLVSTLPALLGR